ncbi:transcription termination/antitermination protein NusG [endosymbiont of Pachyrhynchus infernalis]|uniref:transcription termination/antitermination protein NusG n=1 Tax=endosymbiont of Pachyrhynchus infernalis TaxID=1971488 RepID=UPI000DC742A4|nr:transcription termination/antitermination protein NusG [endosymbiont of Pachyrhynchus infernalis]BBA84822.1 transcription termination/antitermination protein NusG [endosymbiont of Pachyrhynchus infernalis]
MNIESKKWYVIQVFSGSENKVLKYIKNYIKIYDLYNYYDDIIIPKEEIIEIKSGNKKKSERKFFPGYILIKMIINDNTLNFIKKVPNVIGFLGYYNKPSYIKENEINLIFDKINKSNKDPKPKITFNLGEKIRVNDGPFSDFYGIVESIDYIKNRLIVSILIFGRPTPVELNFNQVEIN